MRYLRWAILLAFAAAAWLGGAGRVRAGRLAAPAPPPTVVELAAWAESLCLAEGPRSSARLAAARRAGIDLLDLQPCRQDRPDRILPALEALRAELADAEAASPEEPEPAEEPAEYLVVNPIGGSKAEIVYRELVDEGPLRGVTLAILDGSGSEVERVIHESLRRRKFRATTGPDERIDTHSLPYCPACIFVPREEVDSISVASWRGVFLHEARHAVQAVNNPDMAADFAGPAGGFSVYAAFCEACADEGLNTTRMYRAKERMPVLREALGADQKALVDRACAGHKEAYAELRALYDRLEGEGAFDRLFRPFVWD